MIEQSWNRKGKQQFLAELCVVVEGLDDPHIPLLVAFGHLHLLGTENESSTTEELNF